MRNKYTVGYFIKKFTAIPAEQWCSHYFFDEVTGQKCVLGHCGARGYRGINSLPPEAEALVRLVDDHIAFDVASINNYPLPGFRQVTQRGRVLAALQRIKRKLAR